MAEFVFDSRKTVKEVKDDFKKAFGATLRVYKSPTCHGKQADDNTILTSLLWYGVEDGEAKFEGNVKVGKFEEEITTVYGVGVQVARPDDKKLVSDDITLDAAGKL